MWRYIRIAFGTGPLPHPTAQREYADWMAGRGSGLPRQFAGRCECALIN